jgi:hypothetical protein
MTALGSRSRPMLLWLVPAVFLSAQEGSKLSEEQMRNFLLNAKVVAVKEVPKGKTNPPRLTLSDGKIIHDASFQSVNEEKPIVVFSDGRREVNFRDSYKYNIAAFELAKLLGLEDMMPVTVESFRQNKRGSLSWWLPVMMDEATRIQRGIFPPESTDVQKEDFRRTGLRFGPQSDQHAHLRGLALVDD